MQASGHRRIGQQRLTQPLATSSIQSMHVSRDDCAALLAPLKIEALMLNIDASLRVYTRHQFFVWTQGMLQNLVKHELLVCALRSADPPPYQADIFAGPNIEPGKVGESFRRDSVLVPHLVKTWEDSQYRPVLCDAGADSVFAGSGLADELKRAGLQRLITHGTYDPFGMLASLFVFAAAPGSIDSQRPFLVELIVPYLHLAWMRTRISRPVDESADHAPRSADLLSPREQEVLRWVLVGKSNIEIGIILDISPLTVKNHVQKILRKLNVQNRAQAVGKALALRILNL